MTKNKRRAVTRRDQKPTVCHDANVPWRVTNCLCLCHYVTGEACK